MFMLPVCWAFIDKGIWYEWINESLHSKQLQIIGFLLAEFTVHVGRMKVHCGAINRVNF
jgi:hypothetical protein